MKYHHLRRCLIGLLCMCSVLMATPLLAVEMRIPVKVQALSRERVQIAFSGDSMPNIGDIGGFQGKMGKCQ